MAVTLTSSLKVTFSATLQNAGTLSTASVPIAHGYTLSLPNGTIINTADKVYQARRTVTTGTPDTMDLAGALTDPLGAAVTFAEIVGIIIENKSVLPAEILTIGGNASPFSAWLGAATHTLVVGPGGLFTLFNPALAAYVVTAGTADMLQVAVASGTGVEYDITLVGRSA